MKGKSRTTRRPAKQRPPVAIEKLEKLRQEFVERRYHVPATLVSRGILARFAA